MTLFYHDSVAVEDAAKSILTQYTQSLAYNGQFVTTDKGRVSATLQSSVGDALLNSKSGDVVAIEYKVEAENKHGNFFLETWSNKNEDRAKLGWMFTLDADYLWYYFFASDELYIIDFQKLKTWATGDRFKDFAEKPQSKYTQRNSTFGRCVPIGVIKNEVGFWKRNPREELNL